MSWFSRVVGERSQTPSTAFLDSIGEPSYSGETVGVADSLKLVPVYSAISLVAGSIGSLPVLVYRRVEGGRERATNHRTWKLIHDQPNPEMAADEVWEQVAASLLMWGNAYLAKIRGPLGTVSELWPIQPQRVQVGKTDQGERFFVLDGRADRRYTEEDILQIRGLGTDGLVGLSPIQQARQMLGSVKAMERFTGRFWANSAAPGGTLKHPGKLSPEAAARLKQNWKSTHGSARNAGEVAVLEEGMEWQSVGMPLEDAQFIETQQWNNLQVALLFRLPPYMLGAKSGDALTYSTTEAQGYDFVRWTLRRWLVRIESALLRDPSLFVQGSRFYPEFLVEGLLRADTKTRYESYALALDPAKGWMDRDEIRELENLQPSPESDPSPEDAPDQGEESADD